MKTKLLTLIFAMLLGYGAWGQGATSISNAWNGGTPTQHWFMLETDINFDNTAWETQLNLDNPPGDPNPGNPKEIGFNEVTTTIWMPAQKGTTAPDDDFRRETLDEYNSFGYFVDDGTSCPPDPNPNDYEEWYIIKIPSTKYIHIIISIDAANSSFLALAKTMRWYQFEVDDQNNIIWPVSGFDVALCGSLSPGSMYSGSAFGVNNTFGFEIFPNDINNSNNFIALRIGNNYFPDPPSPFGPISTFDEYTLSVYTTNNICKNALQAPVLDGVIDQPFTSKTNGALLSNTIDISKKEADPDFFYGADDITPTSDKGMWFRGSSTATEHLFVAACGSGIDPKLLVYNQCPSVDAGSYIGGEDQNVDRNPPGDAHDILWNRDDCLIPANDPNMENWPVIRFPGTADIEYFFYLFGSSADEFNFYLLNNNGGDLLPVDWLGFTGAPLGKTNRLDWSTATETQNDYFILEKSAHGINYEILVQIPGQGDAIFQNDYSTLDESPYYQTYYRISQVDYDGTVNTGPQTVVINDSKKVYINLLANPVTNNEIKLRYRSDREQEVVFFITSTDGKAVRSQAATLIEGAAELSIPIPDLSPGMYLLSATLNNERWVEKVVVR